jgi:vancomycin resistance protein VanJ
MAQAYMEQTENEGSEAERPEPGPRRLFGGRWRGDRGIWRRGIALGAIAVLI